MVELKECGIQSAQLEEKLLQAEKERSQIQNRHGRMQELGKELDQDISEIRKMIKRVYQM